jgi:hypothetical protein
LSTNEERGIGINEPSASRQNTPGAIQEFALDRILIGGGERIQPLP